MEPTLNDQSQNSCDEASGNPTKWVRAHSGKIEIEADSCVSHRVDIVDDASPNKVEESDAGIPPHVIADGLPTVPDERNVTEQNVAEQNVAEQNVAEQNDAEQNLTRHNANDTHEYYLVSPGMAAYSPPPSAYAMNTMGAMGAIPTSPGGMVNMTNMAAMPPSMMNLHPSAYMPAMMYMPVPHIAPRLAPPFIEKSRGVSRGGSRGGSRGASSSPRGNSRSPKVLGSGDGNGSDPHLAGTSDVVCGTDTGEQRDEGTEAKEMPASPRKKKPCAFFVQHGSCAFGSKCKFSHPIELAPVVEYNSVGLPRRYGQPVCRYYVQTGRCSYGYTYITIATFHSYAAMGAEDADKPSCSAASELQTRLPVFDLTPYLTGGVREGRVGQERWEHTQEQHAQQQLTQEHTEEHTEEHTQDQALGLLCRDVAECLKRSGALVVRDPRVESHHNARFLDVMESYFGQSYEEKMKDARPHLHYQVGITPEGIERPRCLNDVAIGNIISTLSKDERNAPVPPLGPDPKWRYFWRLGERPTSTRFQELNADPVVPEGSQFVDWQDTMDTWGHLMLDTITTVAEMVALGLGLDKATFTQRMQFGPHLLAPTGTDLDKHGDVGTVFAGFHNDLNFLTVHGKSRFPGLFIWLRDGTKVPVRIPEGCLLLQAGKQMEWLTGGAVQAGYHEVICTEETVKARDAARAAGRSTWRVSSTVFSQLASDEVLRVLDGFREGDTERYPATPVGQFVEEELRFINLASSTRDEGGGE